MFEILFQVPGIILTQFQAQVSGWIQVRGKHRSVD